MDRLHVAIGSDELCPFTESLLSALHERRTDVEAAADRLRIERLETEGFRSAHGTRR